MNKLLFYGFPAAVLLLCATQVDARHLTPSQALTRLEANIEAKHLAKRLVSENITLSYTEQAGIAGIYVFTDKENGLYIAPADDCAPALLGFGDNFDADNIPENMQWWLGQYAEQISYMAQNNITSAASDSDNPRITPLLTTYWNQSDPYNRLCPIVNGSRSVTGCVATATAQVVNFHEWPATSGIGTHSYVWNGQTLSFNYGTTTFDWANMLNKYTSSSSAAACEAVATLMSACGIGVDMNYSPSSSGAGTTQILSFLVNNLGYDKGAAYMSRDCFSDDEWDEIIYSELAAGRPVIYAGYSNTTGHCFVCDGYRNNGYYHINWGWGGLSDGYFLLSALTPSSQGTGGSNSGYSFNQEAIIGIQKPVEGSVESLKLFATGDFEYSSSHAYFWFGQGNAYFNYSSMTVSFIPGICFETVDGQPIYVGSPEITLESLHGRSNIPVTIPTSILPGTYKVYPIAKTDGGDWQKIFISQSYNQYLTARVGNNGAVTFDGSDPDELTSAVTIPSITQNGDWISGQSANATVTFTNSSSSKETVNLTFSFDNVATGMNHLSGNWNIDIPGSSTVTSLLRFGCDMPDGKYTARALRDGTIHISPICTVYVGIRPTDVAIDGSQVEIKEGESCQLNATVLPINAFDRSVIWESSDPSVATVNEHGLVMGTTTGSTTVTATTVNGLKAETQIVVLDRAGVENVSIDDTTIVDVCNMQGIVLMRGVSRAEALRHLSPGLYIIGGVKTLVK